MSASKDAPMGTAAEVAAKLGTALVLAVLVTAGETPKGGGGVTEAPQSE